MKRTRSLRVCDQCGRKSKLLTLRLMCVRRVYAYRWLCTRCWSALRSKEE